MAGLWGYVVVLLFQWWSPSLDIAIDNYEPAQLLSWRHFVPEVCNGRPLVISQPRSPHLLHICSESDLMHNIAHICVWLILYGNIIGIVLFDEA